MQSVEASKARPLSDTCQRPIGGFQQGFRPIHPCRLHKCCWSHARRLCPSNILDIEIEQTGLDERALVYRPLSAQSRLCC